MGLTSLRLAVAGLWVTFSAAIQKFPFITDVVKGLKDKRFAVIVDEAHSSTAGKDIAAVTKPLGSGEQAEIDMEDMITDEIRRSGKQANISINEK